MPYKPPSMENKSWKDEIEVMDSMIPAFVGCRSCGNCEMCFLRRTGMVHTFYMVVDGHYIRWDDMPFFFVRRLEYQKYLESTGVPPQKAAEKATAYYAKVMDATCRDAVAMMVKENHEMRQRLDGLEETKAKAAHAEAEAIILEDEEEDDFAVECP